MPNNIQSHGRDLFELHYPTVDELIRYLARRYRLSADERDDFRSYAMLKMVENDYARLRKYRGDSSFKTYLTVVVQRLFLDYRTHKWGKWRPSTTAQRLGTAAVKLETLMYRDGIGFHEAREILLSSSTEGVTSESLWELMLQLPRREKPRRLEEECGERAAPQHHLHDDAVERRERASLSKALENRLAEASGALSEEDRLILKMRFDEQMSVSQIALALDVKPKALYSKIPRLLKRLRRALEASGVGWDRLSPLAAGHELDLDLDRVFDVAAAQNRAPASV